VSSAIVTRRSGATAPTTAGGADARRLAAVRRGVLGIDAALVAGLAVELAVSRHWQTPSQAMAWAALGSVAAAGALVALRRAPRTRLAMLAVVGVTSLVGVVLHLSANHAAGPLDRDHATTWHALPAWRQWWLAVSGGVGPAPPLVPLGLALSAALMILAMACEPAHRPQVPTSS
jgi:hypothetical protein